MRKDKEVKVGEAREVIQKEGETLGEAMLRTRKEIEQQNVRFRIPFNKKEHNIETTLSERGSRYGDFDGHASVTQRIKAEMRISKNWHLLSFAQKEALEMTAHKIGRILNGDPDYKDSWVDIEGYIHLVTQTLTD